jgi:hypothetical protein
MRVDEILNEEVEHLSFKNGYKLGDPWPEEEEVETSDGEIIHDIGDGEGKESRSTVQRWNREAKELLNDSNLKHMGLEFILTLHDSPEKLNHKVDASKLKEINSRAKKLLDETESSHTFGADTYNGWFVDQQEGESLVDTIRYIMIKTEIILHTPGYWS